MPAISPAKLKIQAARLAKQYAQPAVFVRSMHALLTQYADFTHRHEQSRASSGFISSYNAPSPVMRTIDMALEPIIKKDIEGTLALCDALWLELYLEHRLLACMLLGHLPVNRPEPVLVRLESWIQSIPEYGLMSKFIDHGTKRLRTESPSLMLKLIEDYLSSSNEHVQRLGLRALITQIEDTGFPNLPAVFPMITPLIRSTPSTLRPDLIELVEKLALRSPNETAYILHNCINSTENPDAANLTRRVMSLFSDEIKGNLKLAIKNAQKKADG